MLTPSVWPAWLPPAVAHEAERILGMKFPNVDLLVRLATDGRMETVWRELASTNRFQLD